MAKGINVSAGEGVEFRITGLRETLRAMEKAGADAESMRDLMHSIGMTVVQAANPPRVSGTLAGTPCAGRGLFMAGVRAGTAAFPYAGPIHYGWPARNIAPQPFLTAALQAQQARILDQLDDGIGDIIKRNDLN
mgnify:CR=1 FL=1